MISKRRDWMFKLLCKYGVFFWILLLVCLNNCSLNVRAKEEMEWIRCYFADLSQKDRESDSFRYPFHMETVVLMQHDTNKLG